MEAGLPGLNASMIFRGRTPEGIAALYRVADKAGADTVSEDLNRNAVSQAHPLTAEQLYMVKTGAPDLSPKDPTLDVKYFNNWEAKQFQTTIRRSDIRKIIADKGTGFDEVVSGILATLSEGEGFDDYKAMARYGSNYQTIYRVEFPFGKPKEA